MAHRVFIKTAGVLSLGPEHRSVLEPRDPMATTAGSFALARSYERATNARVPPICRYKGVPRCAKR